MGTSIIKIKKDERWVIYSGDVEATKMVMRMVKSWMHHTIDKIPEKNIKHPWQKTHQENKTAQKRAINL